MHPDAFKFQIAEEQRLAKAEIKRRKRWRWPERLWCASLVAATLDLIEHRSFLGLPSVWVLAGLMIVRILIAGALTVRELYAVRR